MRLVCVAEARFAHLETVLITFLKPFWPNLEGPRSLLGLFRTPLASFRPFEGPSQNIHDFPGESLPHLETHFGTYFSDLGSSALPFLRYGFVIILGPCAGGANVAKVQ